MNYAFLEIGVLVGRFHPFHKNSDLTLFFEIDFVKSITNESNFSKFPINKSLLYILG